MYDALSDLRKDGSVLAVNQQYPSVVQGKLKTVM